MLRSRRRMIVAVFSSVFPATRWSLLGRMASGEVSPGDLLGSYADAIHRYLAMKFTRREGLDDLVQEVLVYLLEHPALLSRSRPGEGSRFRYLLMRLAYNAARNARRRLAGRQPAIAEAVEAAACAPQDFEDTAAMDAAWSASLVRQAWDGLRAGVRDGLMPEDCLIIAELSLRDGRSLREIAVERDLGLATCQRHLARARTCMRQSIHDRLVDCGEAAAQDSAREVADALLGAGR